MGFLRFPNTQMDQFLLSHLRSNPFSWLSPIPTPPSLPYLWICLLSWAGGGDGGGACDVGECVPFVGGEQRSGPGFRASGGPQGRCRQWCHAPSSGPRVLGEGLCLQDPSLLALESGLVHHLRCSRLGSGAPAITGWLSEERAKILGCSPFPTPVGKQAQTLVCFPGQSCAGGTFPLGALSRELWVWAGQPLFLPQSPHLCSSQIDCASHPPFCRAGQGTPRSAHPCSLSPTPQASPSSPHLALGGGAL